MQSQECQLLAEIEFWREMIEHEKDTVSAAGLERMRQALALAERKLLMLEPDWADRESSSFNPPGSPRISARRH